MMIGLGLAACAGPSPQVQVAAADASQPATANTDAAGQAAASESAAAATEEPQRDSTDAVASGSAAPPPETVDNSTPPALSSTPPAEPQTASDPAPTASAPDAPQTATASQPEPSQIAGGASDVPPPGSGLATGRPYVVIRFAESSVDYEKALSEAVKRAVARKPDLAFDLVAVTPRAGTAEELADLTEKAHAEAAAVMKSLNDLGIGPERVSMMTWTGQPTDVNEIRLYIR